MDNNDFITNDNDGLTVGGILTTSLVLGESLMYSNDNGVTWIDITSSVSGTAVNYEDTTLTSTNTVQMKVVDTAGNNSNIAIQLVTIDITAPNITSIIAAVSEEGLLNGIPDTTGDSDTTNSLTATGTMSISDAAGITSVSITQPTITIKSKGVDVVWNGSYDSGSGVYTITGKAGAITVATLTLDTTGAYTFTLADTLEHPNITSEDILALDFGVIATDGAGNTNGIVTTLTINIEDDAPVAVDAKTFVMDIQPDTAEGSLVVSYGADGGYVSEIGIDGNTYTYNPNTDSITAAGTSTNVSSYSFNSSNDELTINTVQGETFVVDMLTGEYSYAALAAQAAAVAPEVSVNQSSGLLGIVNAGALGAIDIGTNQVFTAIDENNDIKSVVVRAASTISLGVGSYYNLTWSADMASDFGFTVTETNDIINLVLVTTESYSQLSITSTDGGPIDNLKLNEFLATVYVKQSGLLDLLALGVLPTLSITATDVAGNTTTDSAQDVAGLSLLDTSSSDNSIIEGTSGGNTLSGTADNDLMYGYAGNDTLNGLAGNDLIRGGRGNDNINGGSGDDVIIGGRGTDTLTGGDGNDTFMWEKDDGGTVASATSDTITDFNNAAITSGGDAVDLSGLLIGELAKGNTVGNLTDYLHFNFDGVNTVLYISTTGAFSSGYSVGNVDQQITFTGVDLVGTFTTDQEVIAQLLKNGNLIVDQATTTTDQLNGTTTIDATIVDNDGDSSSTSVTFDSTDPVVNLSNVAPEVQVDDSQIGGLLGVGALSQIDLTSQAITAADENGNLRSVVVAYTSTIDVNLSDLQLTASSDLANELGLQFTVVNDAGLLGLVTPSSTLTITAIDGGNIDNDVINEFLGTVQFDSATDLLGLSLDLRAALIDGTTVTATDSEGLSTSADIGNIADVDALNSLLGSSSTIIEGTSGDETLTGTAENERLYGYEGNDTIDGGDGDDLIRGGSGNDILSGGAGDDIIIDGNGKDTLNGGAGDDSIGISGINFNSIDGGDGIDTLYVIGDLDFDLTLIDDSKITSIEKIDLSGDYDNKLTLNYSDLLAINDSDKLFVTGDSGDIVSLEGQTFIGTETIDDVTYNTYDIGGTNSADIWVQQNITVI
jgi:T1SS-143 domain-containing protein